LKEYELIKEYYGKDTTKRSGVPLINHIDEGIKILEANGCSSVVIGAYCLHPILQSDNDFKKNKTLPFNGIRTECLLLAMEYRHTANSYLSSGSIEDFIGFSCKEVKDMLVADKVQNCKDFLKYHKNTHPNSEILYDYFLDWFELLGVDYNEEVKIIEEKVI